jgi:hypothetical protein
MCSRTIPGPYRNTSPLLWPEMVAGYDVIPFPLGAWNLPLVKRNGIQSIEATIRLVWTFLEEAWTDEKEPSPQLIEKAQFGKPDYRQKGRVNTFGPQGRGGCVRSAFLVPINRHPYWLNHPSLVPSVNQVSCRKYFRAHLIENVIKHAI